MITSVMKKNTKHNVNNDDNNHEHDDDDISNIFSDQ